MAEAEVFDLGHYARRRDAGANTASANAPGESNWYKTLNDLGGSGFLSANVLRKLDADSDLGRFVELTQEALERLSACKAAISSDAMSADDSFMSCKPIFGELLMFRNLSDSVGLISFKCFQVAASVKAIVDAPELPNVLERVLSRVRAAPFMKFEEACELAEEIENVAVLPPIPGLVEVSNELVESAEASPGSASYD